MKRTLEIAVFNLTAALEAASAGADRIELCENPFEGGTTPSCGTLKQVAEKIGIPVFPIIRPRGGDFLYNDEEFEVMQSDILACKHFEFKGVVLGLLNPDGTIDKERTGRLVELAQPMEVTFHRAFDRAKDPLKALEDVIWCGCTRILTSGQNPEAYEGRELIKQLIHKAGERIIIMPGSGVRRSNIAKLAAYTGAVELHSSARKKQNSAMSFTVKSMNEELYFFNADKNEIALMKDELTKI